MNQASPSTVHDQRVPVPLQAGEQVLDVCRRHWFYLWPLVGLYALAGLVPALVAGFGLDALDLYDGIVARIFWVVAAVYLLYWAARCFLIWYRYQHDIWVITSQRLIDSYKSNPFNLRVATADLVNVQDMTVVRSGLLRTVFDYGDIICQTASEHEDFILTGIDNPRQVQALIDRERDRERGNQVRPRTGL